MNIRHRWLRCLFVSACALSTSCTSTPELRPGYEGVVGEARIAKRIGVHYTREFSEFQHVADPYRNKHQVIFEVGAASVGLFDRLLPKLFDGVTRVDDLVSAGAAEGTFDGVLQPRIASFEYRSRRAGGGYFYWAVITYEFTFHDRENQRTVTWSTRGSGESESAMGLGEQASWSKAVELAMQDAAKQFTRSFSEVPEAIAWARDLAQRGANIPERDQIRRAGSGAAATGSMVAFDGVVSAQADASADAGSAEAQETNRRLAASGLIALRVEIRNESGQELLLERAGVQLRASGKPAIGPVPTTFFTAAATSSLGRFPAVAGGAGAGVAVVQLLFALANVSAMAAEREQKQSISASFAGRELLESRLPVGGRLGGLLFFAAPRAEIASANPVLRLPIINPASATRYVLNVPVTGLPQ